MIDVRRLLLEHALLRHLTPGHLAVLAGCASPRTFVAGESVVRAGEPATDWILVHEGRIELDYGENALAAPAPLVGGDAFGIGWLRPRTAWPCDARAVEPTRTLVLDGICVWRKCETNPALGYELARTLALDLHDRLHGGRRERGGRAAS